MIVIPMLIAMLIPHVAAFPHFFELMPLILRLPAMIPMSADCLVQILLRPLHVVSAPVIPIRMRWNRASHHQRCA